VLAEVAVEVEAAVAQQLLQHEEEAPELLVDLYNLFL
jgi:hypothetical protein